MNPSQADVSFEDALRDLRERFVRGSDDRLSRIEQLLDLLEADPADERTLRDLMIQFHGFAGAGSTYGFPRVSALGSEGQRLCDALLKEKVRPQARDAERWRSLLESLRRELGAEPALEPAAERAASAPVRRVSTFSLSIPTPRSAPPCRASPSARGCPRVGLAAARRRWRKCRGGRPTG